MKAIILLAAALLAVFAGAASGEVGGGGVLLAELSADARSKAIEALNGHDFDGAIRLLENPASEDLFDSEQKKLLGFAYTGRGWAKAMSGRFDEALEDFKKARLEEPEKNSQTYLGIGFSYYKLKKADDALYYLAEASNIDPGNKEAHELLGQIDYERGRLDEAVREWERALALEPENDALKQVLEKAKKEQGVEGSFTKKDTYSFVVKYEGEEKKDLGNLVLDTLYDATANVGGDLGFYPRDPICVTLYTRKQFVDITDAPTWSGGIYDGIIRLPVGGGRIDKVTLSAVLHHEYTHAVIRMMAGGKVPVWLNEGLAQYEERWARPHVEPGPIKNFIPLSELSGSFMGMDADKAEQAYAQSLSAVQYYINRYGMYSLSKLVKLLGEGRGIGEAMEEAAGVAPEKFEEYWHRNASN